MDEDEHIEIHPPNPVVKTVMQYLIGIIGGALCGLALFAYFFKVGGEIMEKEFLFLLIAITSFCAFFGGWMVFLTKLTNRNENDSKE